MNWIDYPLNITYKRLGKLARFRAFQRKFLIPSLIVLTIATPIIIYQVLTQQAKAGWYDTSWEYRKKIFIDHRKVESDSIDIRISSSSDDAEECLDDNSVNLTSTDIEIIEDSFDCTNNDQDVGLRFPGINIPQGATITNAYIQFAVDEFNAESTSTTIYAEDIDDAPTFTTTTSDITNRTRTTASVAWDDIPEWEAPGGRAGPEQQTPNISSVIQEVVDRGGWSQGNDIAIIISGGSGVRVAESVDGDNPAAAPLLHVEFAFTNFPVLIEITDNDLSKFAQSDGDDILFTDSDNNKLDHEIEEYDSSTGALTAWVEVSSLHPTQDTEIHMYYGNPSASNQENVSGTWNSNYIAVYHMNEDSGTTLFDSATASSTENATKEGATQPNPTSSGKIISAQDFVRPDYATVTGLMGTPSDVTVQAWVNLDSADSNGAEVISIGDYVTLRVDDVGTGGSLGSYYDGSGWRSAISDDDVAGTGWRHLAFTVNDTIDSQKLYIDAVEEGSNTESGSISYSGQGSNTEIGRHANGSSDYDYDGKIDEIRVLNTALSQGWLETEYNNQNDPESFFRIGPPEDQNVPILHWKFNEGQGTTANDASGEKNEGTISGATWLDESLCKDGRCLSFDGSDDYASRADDPDLDFASGESFTLEGWFRHPTQSSGQDIIISKYNEAGYKVLMESDGDITCALDYDGTWTPTDSVTSTAATYDDNAWHHFACVKSANTSLTLYIDGVSVGTPDSSLSASTLANSDPFYVGIDADGTSNAWNGELDDIKVYRLARTADEIKADYNFGATVLGAKDNSFLTEGLVGYWKMDEVSDGTGAVSRSDSSGNNNTLTDNSTTASGTGKYGSAADFEKDNFEYLSISDGAQTGLQLTNSFTAATWVNFETFISASIISKGSQSSSNRSVMLGIGGTTDANNFLRTLISTDGSTWSLDDSTPTGQFTAGQWYHIAWTYDGSVIKVYKNGEVIDTIPFSGTPFDDIDDFRLGYLNSTLLDGLLDETRIYNRSLAPNEVAALYSHAPGPLAHYDFESPDASSVVDTSGNENSATLQGGMGTGNWTQGKYGKGLDFDGSANYLEIVDPQWENNLYSFTIGTWVYFDDMAGGGTDEVYRLWRRFSGDSNYPRMRIMGDGDTQHQFFVNSSTQVDVNDPSKTITAGRWYHIAATRDETSGVANLYIDGVLKATDTTAGSLDKGTNNPIIGGDTGLFLDGKLDEFKVYNYPRTPQQIVEDMNAEHPAGGSPVGSQTIFYKFDEMQGSTANNSGNAPTITGSISGAAWTASGKDKAALDFDGTDDVVTVTNATAIDLNESLEAEHTFSAWVYADSDGEGNVGQVYQKGTNTYLRVDTESGGSLDVEASLDLATTDATLNISSAITTGTWNHIVVTYTDDADDEIDIYINGIHRGTSTNGVGSPAADSNNLLIGGSTSANFDGKIDEFKIYNSALTASQVALDYNSGKSIQLGVLGTDASGNPSNAKDRSYCPPGDDTADCGPLGEWKFEETSWNNNCSANTVLDTSGSAYHMQSCTSGNGPTESVNGKIGNALATSGGADHLTLTNANAPNLNFGSTSDSYTVSFWLQYLGDSGYIITKGFSGWGDSDQLIQVNAFGGDLQFCINDGTNGPCTGNGSQTSVTTNEWAHWSFVRSVSDDQLKVYKNGVLVDADTDTTTSEIATTAEWIIGDRIAGSYPNNAIQMKMDELKIYDYERTPAQIAWDYNRGKPVAHYKFDECSGTTAYDSSGNGLNGTVTPGGSGNTSASSCTTNSSTDMRWDGRIGKRNYGLDFDGTNDYVTIADNDKLDIHAMSISAWIKGDNFGTDTDENRIVFKGGGSHSGNSYSLDIKDSMVSFAIDGAVPDADGACETDEACVYGTTELQTDTWYHVTAVFDGTTGMFVYLNGQLDGSNTLASPVNTVDPNSNALHIGGRSDSAEDIFDGIIDDVRIYNYPLTAQQVKTVMNDGVIRWGPSTGSP